MKSFLTNTYLLTTTLYLLVAGAASAQNWQDVDKFRSHDDLSAGADAVGTGANGALFSAGWAEYDASGNSRAVIRRSLDSGANWTTVDDYLPDTWSSASYRAFGGGANGNIFAAGQLWEGLPNTGTKTWIVRESLDNGATWATADAFFQGTTAKPSCADIKVNPYTGDVFAVGRDNTSSSTGFYWAVRKRAAGAPSFETVDRVGAPPINDASGVGFHPTAGVFVVGKMGDGQRDLWTVRRSANRGTTWTTVDIFQDSTKTYSEAHGIAVSASGAIYVCGRAAQTVKGKTVNNWVVRRSLDGGATWTTVDRFGAEPAPYGIGTSIANTITVAPSGIVFVTGTTADPSHLIVRKGTTAPNGTMSWTTSNDYQLVAGQPSDAHGIISDAAGNIFTAGKGQIDAAGLKLFLTRKLTGPQ